MRKKYLAQGHYCRCQHILNRGPHYWESVVLSTEPQQLLNINIETTTIYFFIIKWKPPFYTFCFFSFHFFDCSFCSLCWNVIQLWAMWNESDLHVLSKTRKITKLGWQGFLGHAVNRALFLCDHWAELVEFFQMHIEE